jgi:hypothetical protein
MNRRNPPLDIDHFGDEADDASPRSRHCRCESRSAETMVAPAAAAAAPFTLDADVNDEDDG